MSDIHLDFTGPFTFTEGDRCIFHVPVSASSGVYLWAIRQLDCDEYLMHYVGETARLAKRHREHMVQILGLNYGIWDPDEAQRGVSKLVWTGLWRDRSADGPARAIRAYATHHDAAIRYLSVIEVFLVELQVDGRLRKHVEGCLGWHIRSGYPQHKVLYPDDNHIGRTKEYRKGMMRISAPVVIRGLDPVIPY